VREKVDTVLSYSRSGLIRDMAGTRETDHSHDQALS